MLSFILDQSLAAFEDLCPMVLLATAGGVAEESLSSIEYLDSHCPTVRGWEECAVYIDSSRPSYYLSVSSG